MADEVERAKRFAADAGRARAWTARWSPRWRCPPGWRSRPSAPTTTRAACARAIDNCGRVCEVLQAEGLRPLHHSHVGGVFETEDEIVRLLDDLGPDVIGFGPDTGHLRWAGIDPAPFIRRYADRHRRHPHQGLLPRLPRRPRAGRA